MYADKMTEAIKKTLLITERRRRVQQEYNEKHGITPRTVKRDIAVLVEPEEIAEAYPDEKVSALAVHEQGHEYLTAEEIQDLIQRYEEEMKMAAKEFRFEDAAHYRDLMRKYQQMAITYL